MSLEKVEKREMQALDKHKITLNYHRREMQKLASESDTILETLQIAQSNKKLDAGPSK